MTKTAKTRSPYLQVLQADDSIPIDPLAVELWLTDIDRATRRTIRPLLQMTFAVLLHLIWFTKRLPLPQFSAHTFLQKTICWFCTWFVSREATLLILRHFATESNILNFLLANTGNNQIEPLHLYPEKIDDMLEYSFVEHDQELFRMMLSLSPANLPDEPLKVEELDWRNWREIDLTETVIPEHRTQILDFETAHSLFMCLFCLLLTADEYRDAINGFNLDQSIAIRIGKLIGKPELGELAYNKYPHYLVGPWNLSQRFLMHGFFTEYLHAQLLLLNPEPGLAICPVDGSTGDR